MTEHKVTAIEPCWVYFKLKWVSEKESLREEDIKKVSDRIKRYPELLKEYEYVCSCGEVFNDITKAEKHIKEVKAK